MEETTKDETPKDETPAPPEASATETPPAPAPPADTPPVLPEPPYRTGARVLEPAAAAAHPPLTVKTGATLPKAISYRSHTTPIDNQGARGTCVAFATKKAIETWTAILGGLAPSEVTALSALDIYNQARALAGWDDQVPDGLYVYQAMKVLMAPGGIATAESCPYDPSQVNEAPEAGVWRSPEWNLAGYQVGYGVDALKAALQQGPAVWVTVCDESLFFPPHDGSPIHPSTVVNEGHALCITGYDDDKEAFEAANSWGESYGEDGWVWIGYGFVTARGADVTTFQPDLSTRVPGDVTYDGRVNPADVVRALAECVGLRQVTDTTRSVLDLNQDHHVDVRDAMLLLRKMVGL